MAMKKVKKLAASKMKMPKKAKMAKAMGLKY
jgi:hypothetical protein